MDLKLKKVKNKVTNKLAEQKKIYIFLNNSNVYRFNTWYYICCYIK